MKQMLSALLWSFILCFSPVSAHATDGFNTTGAPLPLGAGDHAVMWILPTGKVGVGTAAPLSTLEVAGAIKLGSEEGCAAENAGTLRYNDSKKQFEGCTGSGWKSLRGTLECTQAMRHNNDGITILSGDGAAIESVGMGASGADDSVWGLRCASGWNKTGCHLAVNTANSYDLWPSADSCTTDDEEFDGGAYVSISCCRVN